MPRKKKSKVPKTQKEWEEKIKRFIEERLVISPEELVRIGVFGIGTVVAHNLNLAGMLDWFGRGSETIKTGLPYPFHERIRFPWEKAAEPNWEDKVTEWGLPMLVSWMLVYHPDAIAKFVDALVPF